MIGASKLKLGNVRDPDHAHLRLSSHASTCAVAYLRTKFEH